MIRGLGIKSIYLSHYEDAQPARDFAKRLKVLGFKVVVAEDARKRGRDFVSKVIGDSDLTIIVNPESDAENILFETGGVTFDLTY